MADTASGEVTRLLRAIRSGEASAKEKLFEVVYDELRVMARGRMRGGAYDTLQPTALVHEVFFKLSSRDREGWENRAHFFGAAAEAMRQILVDKARARMRLKRGGGAERVDFTEEMAVEHQRVVELIELDHALDRLESVEPDHARVVKLRYFAGLTVEEISEVLHRSPRSVDRMWYAARAWLKEHMSGEHENP
ncbi:MAG: sigma-70 family RNA polymerase sigma factor [Acidobacteria bacterium]|nr:sigma-70 family RNA polymerase sigma factor [Acidobacteriota bacterium]